MILLDTNVISEGFRSNPNDAARAWLNRQRRSDLFLCAPVLAELRYGMERLPAGARRNKLGATLQRVEADEFLDRILPFDQSAAHQFGRVVARRYRLGRPILPMDALIAAIALVHNAVVATRDIADFEGVGLDLIDPFMPRA